MRADEIDFEKAWTLFDIAAAAELRVQEAPASPTDAEIVPGVEARWYLVRTFPGDDVRALRWLARRRFGVFRPMQQREDRKSGRKLQGFEPVFPGWLFVFCWRSRANFSRVERAPGVFGLFRHPTSCEPIVVGDEFVQRLRALSWVYDETAPAARTHAGVAGARHAKRIKSKLTRQQRRTLRKLTEQARSLQIWDERAWARANALAPGERISLLMRALTGPAARSSGCPSER